MMKPICIIPARGGSKRIPRKNIKNFFGKPIIAYSIELAQKSNLFKRIIVSTEDHEIGDVAKQFGAEIPFYRSLKNADDHSGIADVLIEAVLDLEKTGESIERVCCILPTAPLIDIRKFIDSYEIFTKNKFESLVPVLPFSYPILRSLKIENKNIKMNWPEYLTARSQDLPKAYHDTGSYYWVTKEALLSQKRLFCENSGYTELTEIEVQDIDNEDDWKMAEIKYKIRNGF